MEGYEEFVTGIETLVGAWTSGFVEPKKSPADEDRAGSSDSSDKVDIRLIGYPFSLLPSYVNVDVLNDKTWLVTYKDRKTKIVVSRYIDGIKSIYMLMIDGKLLRRNSKIPPSMSRDDPDLVGKIIGIHGAVE
jgi:hypothetical protein